MKAEDDEEEEEGEEDKALLGAQRRHGIFLSSRPPPRRSHLFVNANLTPLQERNLQSALGGRQLVDRVGLILAIFAQRARTREAKLQVREERERHEPIPSPLCLLGSFTI